MPKFRFVRRATLWSTLAMLGQSDANAKYRNVCTGSMSLHAAPSLAQNVQAETEDERRWRLQKLQAAQRLPSGGMSSLASGYGAALGGVSDAASDGQVKLLGLLQVCRSLLRTILG